MTTDGIRRKPPAPARTGSASGVAPAPAPPHTSAAQGAALRGLDALDDRKGTARGPSTRTRGTQGALAGLLALEGRRVRAALAGALLGLSLLGTSLGGVAQAAEAIPLRDGRQVTLVDTGASAAWRQEAGAPPPQLTALQARILAQVSSNTVVVADLARAAEAHAERPVRGGLPETLATLSSGVRVVHGTDPGDFYCEHAFFTSTQEALRDGASVLRNAHGEVLTGFLHNPADPFTHAGFRAEGDKVQSERHEARRDVVGAALRGFYEDARGQLDAQPGGDGAFRVLLTGYAGWGDVVDNPTGDFVAHRENIDAAMQRAFGADLVTAEGRVLGELSDAGGMQRTRLAYEVRDAQAPGGVRAVIVDAAQLPVTDAAIDGGGSSLQRLMRDAAPHAVLSMGVASGSTAFQAEFHADDGGLHVELSEVGAVQRHDAAKSATVAHPDNWALGRAILRGHDLLERPAEGPRVAVPGAGPMSDLRGG